MNKVYNNKLLILQVQIRVQPDSLDLERLKLKSIFSQYILYVTFKAIVFLTFIKPSAEYILHITMTTDI